MPFYEYVCAKCGKTTEARRPMSQADAAIACEHCGSRRTKRAHSVFSAGGTKAGAGGSAGGGHAHHGGGCGCCGGTCARH